MAHFAKLDSNKKVIAIEVVDNANLLDGNGDEQESIGIQYLITHTGWSDWKQTSYNTRGGKYYEADNTTLGDQSKAFRKNYAALGMSYDVARDAFVSDAPAASWTLNETSCLWEPPVAEPTVREDESGNTYTLDWDDGNQRWLATIGSDEYQWDASNLQWVAL